jgi:ATP adenylyltransferase/5',5'''-P-1,P-4-tetraphosphate phosphorylase II
VIAHINSTHILVFNRVCIFRPQLMLLSEDSYRRQHLPLELIDIIATYEVLTSLNEGEQEFYTLYNCGFGSSREHKHVQFLPKVDVFFPDDRGFDNGKIPYLYFLKYLPMSKDDPDGANNLYLVYEELLAQAKSAVNTACPSGREWVPHNVILTKDWLMVIPRGSNGYEGVSTSSAGMVGSVFLANKDQLKEWKNAGMTKVLAELGIPAVHKK